MSDQPTARTPLPAVLAFTFLSSVGTGVVSAGIFFLARHRFGFDARENFVLGAIFGLTYIPGALAVGPILRRLRSGTGLFGNERAVLGALAVVLGLLCFIPVLAAGPPPLDGRLPARWPMWLMVAVYSPVSGAVWPIVEGFLSGGRTSSALRRAIGRFNVTWSVALVIAFWGIAPLVESHSLLLLAILGGLHIGSIGILCWFTPHPGVHGTVEHDLADRALARRLLAVFRVELPCAFLGISALEPYLAAALADLGVAAHWETPVAATWMASRVAAFAVMERWHGWHGTWSTPIASGALMVAGFAVAVVVPIAVGGVPGLWGLLLGLFAFGLGVGVTYAAALYYAMDVGSAQVDAGGTHEALIGVGYSIGPMCGLIALSVSPGRQRAMPHYEPLFVGLVCSLITLVIGIAIVRSWTQARLDRNRPVP